MTLLKKLLALALPIAALTLGACGGSTNVVDGGIGGTGISSSGKVTGFGSVYVNGVKYKTDATAISDDDADDGNRIGEDKLKVGHVVEVKGKSSDDSNGIADAMEKASEVKGPVDTIFDTPTKTLKVMGQTVLIDNNTAIDNNIGANGLTDLKVGDLVEVHGFRDATGTIVATRIEKQGPVAQYRVRGAIASLDAATKTFKVGDLTVDYGTATVLPTGVTLVNGQRVKVKADTAPAAGKLTATRVKVKKIEDSAKSELEGVITKFTSATDFEVNGQKVTTDANTRFEHGTAADLKEGARVEAKGTAANGILTASKIEFAGREGNKGDGEHNEAHIKFSGLVASSSLADKTITVLGQKFTVTANTMFEDRIKNSRPFNIGNFDTLVKTGAHVQITAFKDGANLVASRVDVNNRTDVSVQGPVAYTTCATAPCPINTVGGVTVTTDATTRYSIDGKVLSDLTAFIGKAPAGTIIKVKTKAITAATDTAIDATGANQGEVEIED